MSCEICGRGACTRSFHSLEDQELFDAREKMIDDVDLLRLTVQNMDRELAGVRKILFQAIDTLQAVQNWGLRNPSADYPRDMDVKNALQDDINAMIKLYESSQ